MDVANYPKVMHEVEREKVLELDDQQEDIYPQESINEPQQGGEHGMRKETRQQQTVTVSHATYGTRIRTAEHGRARTGRAREPNVGGRRHEGSRQPDPTVEDREADDRQYPETPRRRRTHPDAQGFGGWDMIDNLTVQQCARMPMGVHTVEFIPNSLHDEWTKAWKYVQRMRDAAESNEERDMH